MKFKIKQNKHSHSSFGSRLRIFWAPGKKAHFKITFHDNCWYPYVNKDSNDFNKLVGIRYLDDHVNEAGLVWLPDFEKQGYIRLWYYGYESQKRYHGKVKEPLAVVKTGQQFEALVKKEKGGYQYKADGNAFFKNHSNPKAWFTIQPYHGGDNKAAHTMLIEMVKA